MKKLLTIVLCCLMLSACSSIRKLTSSDSMKMPVTQLATHTINKDYKIIGRVRGEYERQCFLMGAFCFGEGYVFDDLMAKARSMGANEVLDIVIDDNELSVLWTILYSHQTTVANGLAVQLNPQMK